MLSVVTKFNLKQRVRLIHQMKSFSPFTIHAIAPVMLSLITPFTSFAEDSSKFGQGIAPSSAQWVAFKPKSDPAPVSSLTEEQLKDPKQLLAFLRDRPEALDPSKMTPFIAIEVGQTLLYGGEARKAITLLDKAREKWPSQAQLLQTWARALVKLGMPSYARRGIEQWRDANPTVVVEGYTQYLYALCIYLEGPDDFNRLNKTIELIAKLLRDEPQYVGPDGVSAAQLNSFINELKGRLSARR